MKKGKLKNTYDLFGTKIEITYTDKVLDEDGNWMYGQVEYFADKMVITMSKYDRVGNKVTKESLARTLRHELYHAIFSKGMYFNTNEDEPLVEWLSICTDALHKQGLTI